MSIFEFFFGKPPEREVLDNGDGGWTTECNRGNRTEKVVRPDHGDPYTETTYRNGQTYREYEDGTVEKIPHK